MPASTKPTTPTLDYQVVDGAHVLTITTPGGVLTLIYLSHGSLLRVMLIHAAIDIVALLVRPAITEWLARRGRPEMANA